MFRETSEIKLTRNPPGVNGWVLEVWFPGQKKPQTLVMARGDWEILKGLIEEEQDNEEGQKL